MASMNRVFLIGNLTRDPELRRAPSGAAVAELRLAVSESYRDRQTNEVKERVCYVDITVWNTQAEHCQKYLSRGRAILVEGSLVYDEWKNQKGETRSRIRVRADRIQFLGPRPSSSGQAPASSDARTRPAPDSDPTPPQYDPGADSEQPLEDLPF
ncbi:MAG: single-stranded DNA-binding protein [Kiritimatiellia bacterium]|jgi:single-strand DNA-binding protein